MARCIFEHVYACFTGRYPLALGSRPKGSQLSLFGERAQGRPGWGIGGIGHSFVSPFPARANHAAVERVSLLYSLGVRAASPQGGQPGRPPRGGASPIPSQAVWCRPVSFPTSADRHAYNVS